eukprot:tig00000681_g3070.t1
MQGAVAAAWALLRTADGKTLGEGPREGILAQAWACIPTLTQASARALPAYPFANSPFEKLGGPRGALLRVRVGGEPLLELGVPWGPLHRPLDDVAGPGARRGCRWANVIYIIQDGDNTKPGASRVEDVCFWYKAEQHPSFRLGSMEFWKYHLKHFDPAAGDGLSSDEDEGAAIVRGGGGGRGGRRGGGNRAVLHVRKIGTAAEAPGIRRGGGGGGGTESGNDTGDEDFDDD